MNRIQKAFLWVGMAFLTVVVVLSIVAPMFQDPTVSVKPMMVRDEMTGQMVERTVFLPPSSAHWLGTDQSGRDVLARLCAGARTSLIIGLVVEFISLFVGTLMAVLGVYAPRWLASPLMRITDAMFAFPDILLAILLIGILQGWPIDPNSMWSNLFLQGYIPVIVALSITAWPGTTRLLRGVLASLKDREFVVAAKAGGGSTFYVVRKHVLPQLWGLLLAVAMVELAGVILAESTLSFIGIGVQPPNPSWGNMIDKARQDMNSHPMLLFWPCLILSLTIFALNFVGDGVRTLTDPKSA